jgi:hypothetical protein
MRSASRRKEDRVTFKIHARAIGLVLVLSVIVGGVGVSAMPHGPVDRPAACDSVGSAQADAPNIGAQCVATSGGVFDVFSRVFDDLKAIHASVEARAQTVVNQWNNLNDFIDRLAQATPAN